jgi:predicted nucleic-acid-binding Zn-ribbon protein
MKSTHRCPKCRHPKVWRVGELRVEGQDASNTFFAVPAAIAATGEWPAADHPYH